MTTPWLKPSTACTNRVDQTAQALAHDRASRAGDRRMGRLQPPPYLPVLRRWPTSRLGGRLLHPEVPDGGPVNHEARTVLEVSTNCGRRRQANGSRPCPLLSEQLLLLSLVLGVCEHAAIVQIHEFREPVHRIRGLLFHPSLAHDESGLPCGVSRLNGVIEDHPAVIGRIVEHRDYRVYPGPLCVPEPRIDFGVECGRPVGLYPQRHLP